MHDVAAEVRLQRRARRQAPNYLPSGVEQVGTCLEGDNCPRFHCTACGAYWLKDPQHVCGTAEAIEQKVLTWMEEQLRRDADLGSSARAVVQRVINAGLGHSLLNAFGDRLILHLWFDHHPETGQDLANQDELPAEDVFERRATQRGDVDRGPRRERDPIVMPTLMGIAGPPAATGQRRVDVGQLTSEGACSRRWCWLRVSGYASATWTSTSAGSPRPRRANERPCSNGSPTTSRKGRPFGSAGRRPSWRRSSNILTSEQRSRRGHRSSDDRRP